MGCRHGIHVSLEFFEDIMIPEEQMQPSTVYNHNQKLWCWQACGSHACPAECDMVGIYTHSFDCQLQQPA